MELLGAAHLHLLVGLFVEVLAVGFLVYPLNSLAQLEPFLVGPFRVTLVPSGRPKWVAHLQVIG